MPTLQKTVPTDRLLVTDRPTDKAVLLMVAPNPPRSADTPTRRSHKADDEDEHELVDSTEDGLPARKTRATDGPADDDGVGDDAADVATHMLLTKNMRMTSRMPKLRMKRYMRNRLVPALTLKSHIART